MKKLLQKPPVLTLALLVVYIAGLLLGSAAVSAYPIYYKQRNYFTSRAEDIAAEYLQGNYQTMKEMSGTNLYFYIYDTDGNRLISVTPKSFHSTEAPVVSLDRVLPAVLSGKEVYRPVRAQVTQRNLTDIMILVGTPVWDRDQVAGAVFLAKNLMDLPEAIMGYCVYFTIFYWLSAYFIVSNIRKSKKLDKLQQNYIANVTHALKTPVASIKALSETLCDGVEPDPDRQKVYYGMILQEANHQDHMIRNILELSKLQSDGMDFTKTKCSADELFTPILEKYFTLADCMGIDLHISDELFRLPSLYTNAACVRQIMELLLDNALKFTPENGNVWMEAVCTKKQVVFCIRDDGLGIAKDALPHVFERFFKGSHDFNASGSGLGLAIARELTAGLRERIWVESEPEKGAAFYFTVHLR